MKLQAVLSVWGTRYTEFFLNIALPALCTSGNLLGFARYEAELDIYTTADSRPLLAHSPALQALSGYVDVRLSAAPVDTAQIVAPDQKYQLMSTMHRAAIERSGQIDSALFFLAPDAIFADGTLAYARAQLEAGKRAIMLAGTRVSSEGFLAELTATYNPRGRFGMVVPPRDLVSLLIRHPHEQLPSFFWGAPLFTEWPSHLFFPVGDEGFVLRGFHHHPLAVYPAVRGALNAGTIDAAWLEGAVPDLADWHLVRDTDDGFVVDAATRPEDRLGAYLYPDPIEHVAAWALEKTDLRHRWMATQSFQLHSAPITARWEAVEAQADEVVWEILRRISERGGETPLEPALLK